jgi:hypothetical protein
MSGLAGTLVPVSVAVATGTALGILGLWLITRLEGSRTHGVDDDRRLATARIGRRQP